MVRTNFTILLAPENIVYIENQVFTVASYWTRKTMAFSWKAISKERGLFHRLVAYIV